MRQSRQQADTHTHTQRGRRDEFGREIKKSAYSVEKDLRLNADVVVNSLVLCLSRNLPVEALGNSAVPQSTSCLHVNVHKWLPTQ